MNAKEIEIIKNNIKRRYRNGPDNIGKDLVAPCLKNSVLYRRGTGFFSSGALVGYATAMEHLINENVKIQIICSPVIHDKDLMKILENNITSEQKQKTIQKLADNIVLKAIGYTLDNKRRDYKNSLLSYMIAKEILEIKFAVPYDFQDIKTDNFENLTNNLYHVKTGYFKLKDGEIVAFDGSFNESDSGHQHHIEQTQVWRSWKTEDNERMQDVIKDVDDDWEGKNPFLKTFSLSEEAIEIIKYEGGNFKVIIPKNDIETSVKSSLRYYQIKALEAWKNNQFKGIIALATGTGKTKTAIAAIKNFKNSINNSLVIVTAPYVQLADQWVGELNAQGISTIEVYDNKENWISKVNNIIDLYNLNNKQKTEIPVMVCVNKTFKSENFQKIITRAVAIQDNQLIIVDECHHFNKKENIKKLPKNIKYRLGLSATPYEPEQPKALDEYFDSIVYEYSIGDAIKEKYLCPYEYHPILIEFSQNEAERYIELVRKIQNSNKKIDDEIEYSENEDGGIKELDRLFETVASKLTVLQEKLISTGIKPLTLFYCGEGYVEINNEKIRQIDTLTRLLYNLNWKVGKITSLENNNERQNTLLAFKNQQIDAVASMRVLDEGIDVPDCRQAYILASQRLTRQGVQRRGRILRMSENKIVAKLYDFIIIGPKLSLNELDKLYSRELERAKLFAADAVNKNECMAKLSGV
jgi:superfamily II DNA or RNA helicase